MNFSVPCPDEAAGYTKLRKLLKSCVRATAVQAWVIRPLDPRLPRLPLLIRPTCMKWNKDQCYYDVADIKFHWAETLRSVLGPLQNIASDGDSCRRAVFISHSMYDTNWSPVDHPTFVIRGRKDAETGDISLCCESDPQHCVKK